MRNIEIDCVFSLALPLSASHIWSDVTRMPHGILNSFGFVPRLPLKILRSFALVLCRLKDTTLKSCASLTKTKENIKEIKMKYRKNPKIYKE